MAFNDFLKNYDRQVTIEMILDEGKHELTKDWVINDHNALVEKMKAKEVFNNRLSDVQISNLAKYFVALPSEIVMVLWQSLAATEDSEYNIARLWDTVVDGVLIKDFVVNILNAK